MPAVSRIAQSPSNRTMLLSEISRTPGMSRQQLAAHLGLSPATAGTHVRRLIQHGFVSEGSSAVVHAGRPRIPLTPIRERGIVIGVAMGAADATVTAVGIDGTVIDSDRTGFRVTRPDITALADLIREVAGRTPWPALAVGVAVSGVVDTVHGVVTLSTVMNWVNHSLGRDLEAAVGLPVFAENDVLSLASRELTFAPWVNDSFLLTHLDEGIGMAIVEGRRVIRGARHGSTEFGHISLNPDGAQCRCGNRGCIQTVFGWRELNEGAPSGVLPDHVDDLTPAERDYLGHRAAELGRGIGSVSTLLGIDHIRVTGRTTALWDAFSDPLGAAVRESTVTLGTSPTITVVPWSQELISSAAASIALDRYVDGLH